MTHSTLSTDRPLLDPAKHENTISLALMLCMAAAFIVRFAIPSQVLNAFMDYTSESGALYEKLHVGSYAIFLLAPAVLLSRPFFLKTDEVERFRSLLRFTLWMLGIVAYLVATGKPGSSGFLVDTYIVAAVASLMMLALGEAYRRALGNVTLGLLILSGVIGIVEAVTKSRFLPYERLELTFRPLGLTEHPLTLGALCATAVGFIPLTRWPLWVKVALVFLMLIATVASGARFSLLTAIAEALLMLILLPWPGLTRSQARRGKVVVLILSSVMGAVLTTVLASAGLLSRFGDTLFDDNFMSRVSIYEIFKYVGWNDILFGMRGDVLVALVASELKLPAIESAPVAVTLALGLPLALLFAGLLLWIVYRLLKGAPAAVWIASGGFLAAALSNNMLSVKTPTVAIFFVLLIAFAVPRSRREDHPA
jgi:hypothetical protein